jgi:hypothetical protein
MKIDWIKVGCICVAAVVAGYILWLVFGVGLVFR